MRKSPVELNFIKVKGHTGVDGNEEADRLEKRQLGLHSDIGKDRENLWIRNLAKNIEEKHGLLQYMTRTIKVAGWVKSKQLKRKLRRYLQQ